jgi:hypothetical protein
MADNLAPAPRLGGKPGESNMANAAVGLPPATAAAAPTPASTQTGTGLCAALNAFYAEQAKTSGFIADRYEIYFADPILENASMIPAGPIEKEFTGTTPLTSASGKLDPAKQNSPLQVRTRGATAGQQITQFIDQVLRSSRYIGNQQNVIWNTKTNSWDLQGKSGQVFAWFNIVGNAIPLKYDPARNDFAYRIIYTITPYQTPIQSEYFTSGVFRGVHKVYNYWFTGQNTQVLQYEQNFNTLWTQAITGDKTTATIRAQTNPDFLWKKAYLPASNQTRQGGTGKTFEPGANAADILYTNDYAKIKLSIIGDPAWIPSVIPITSGKFVTAAFNPDGSINTTASVPYFKFAWNRPVDYDLNTGLMDPGANNINSNRLAGIAGDAQESVAYIASRCRSTFKAGKFTQELEGTWLQDVNNTAATTSSDVGRKTDPSATTTLTNSGGTTSSFTQTLQAGASTALNTVLPNLTKELYTKVANSITSISNATLRTPVPPVSIVAAVGQTNEFGGLEAPPTLAVKPGENGVGGVGAPPVVDPAPTQGIVNDDQI